MCAAKRLRACVLLIGALALITMPGCHRSMGRRHSVPCDEPARSHGPTPCAESNPPTHSYLIFNADGGETYPIVERPSDWPETFVADRWPEETIYRETIRDWQGTFWSDRDRYERRFHAVRRGASRR